LYIRHLDVLLRETSTEEAVAVTEATSALLRRLIVTLPAAEKYTFVRGILPFLLGLAPSPESAASVTASDAELSGQEIAAAKTQYITMLLSSVLVFLDKTSPVFADLDASDGVLRRCADFALRTQLKDSASPLRSELGAPQLLALIINKVQYFTPPAASACDAFTAVLIVLFVTRLCGTAGFISTLIYRLVFRFLVVSCTVTTRARPWPS
jgi:hypothetical protein